MDIGDEFGNSAETLTKEFLQRTEQILEKLYGMGSAYYKQYKSERQQNEAMQNMLNSSAANEAAEKMQQVDPSRLSEGTVVELDDNAQIAKNGDNVVIKLDFSDNVAFEEGDELIGQSADTDVSNPSDGLKFTNYKQLQADLVSALEKNGVTQNMYSIDIGNDGICFISTPVKNYNQLRNGLAAAGHDWEKAAKKAKTYGEFTMPLEECIELATPNGLDETKDEEVQAKKIVDNIQQARTTVENRMRAEGLLDVEVFVNDNGLTIKYPLDQTAEVKTACGREAKKLDSIQKEQAKKQSASRRVTRKNNKHESFNHKHKRLMQSKNDTRLHPELAAQAARSAVTKKVR